MILVALLAEGVDRNTSFRAPVSPDSTSPSSRRAWIEMIRSQPFQWRDSVALLAEGVDRNDVLGVVLVFLCQSPSSRRAWIEISHCINIHHL